MKRFAIIAALAAVALPAAASAANRAQEAQGYRVMDDFAACVVEADPALAYSLINVEPGSRGERDVAARVFKRHDDCLAANRASQDPLLLRGAVAQALYRREYGNARLRVAAADAVFPEPGTAVDIDAKTAARNRVMRSFGICVARAQPAATRDLLFSRFGSYEDTRALGAVRPALARCMPKGLKVDFSRTALRAVLAEGLYRYARAVGAESGGGA